MQRFVDIFNDNLESMLVCKIFYKIQVILRILS